MAYHGWLADTADDGDSVYVHSKVHGYDWDDNGRVELHDGQYSGRSASACIYDRAMSIVNYGWVEVCVNRQPFQQDRCQRQFFKRPENSLPPVEPDELLP